MIVTCSKCSTKFKISDEKISASGVKVRCSKCKHTFIVTTGGVTEIDQPNTTNKNSAPSSIPPSQASKSTLPPPPKEQPLPPPPKIADTLPPPKAKESKPTPKPDAAVTSIPDDIFASPTKVGPAPEGLDDGKQPLPPPPPPPPAIKSSAFEKAPAVDSFPSLDESPTEKIPSPPQEAFGVIEPAKELPADVVSSIDLDSDFPIMDADSRAVTPKDLDSSRPALSEDLFSDLDSAVDQLAPPGESSSFPAPEQIKKSDTPSTNTPNITTNDLPTDDPFAGIDVNVPASAPEPVAVQPPVAEPILSSQPPSESSLPTAMDDPFSDIDLAPGSNEDLDSSKAQEPVASEEAIFNDPFASLSSEKASLQQQAVSEQEPGDKNSATDSSGDLFSDLGDPFAGLEQQSPTQPPPIPKEDSDQLFDSLPASMPGQDGQQTTPSSEGMDPSVGHDPFAALESTDSFSGEQPQLDIGLSLGEDGQVQGEDLPPAPPPTKTIGTSEQQVQSPAAAQRPPGPPPMLTKPSEDLTQAGGSVLFKVIFGVVLLMVLFFAFVAFRHGGKPDLSKWSTYVEAFTGDSFAFSAKGDLQVLDMASTSYKNKEGSRLVVLWGKIHNDGTTSKDNVTVRGQLLRNNKPVSSLSVPVGVVFSPEDVFSMLDDIAVRQAYAKKYKPKLSTVSPDKEVPFMVVMVDHPDNLVGLKVRVIPDQKDDPLSELHVQRESLDKHDALQQDIAADPSVLKEKKTKSSSTQTTQKTSVVRPTTK